MKENKLIAEFMGYHTSGDQFKDENGFWDDFAWHRSWDSLMPVLIKIADMLEATHSPIYRSIDEAYDEAVQFIKTHNDEK